MIVYESYCCLLNVFVDVGFRFLFYFDAVIVFDLNYITVLESVSKLSVSLPVLEISFVNLYDFAIFVVPSDNSISIGEFVLTVFDETAAPSNGFAFCRLRIP